MLIGLEWHVLLFNFQEEKYDGIITIGVLMKMFISVFGDEEGVGRGLYVDRTEKCEQLLNLLNEKGALRNLDRNITRKIRHIF